MSARLSGGWRHAARCGVGRWPLALGLSCLLWSPGCIEPDAIGDLEGIVTRIQDRADGGGLGDAAVAPSPGVDAATGPAPVDPCGDVAADYFAVTCTGSVCHSAETGNPLDLESPMLASRLVGVASSSLCEGAPYIDPAAPQDSLLLLKLEASVPCGSPMPLGQQPPSEMQKDCVLQWIEGVLDQGGVTPVADAGVTPMADAGADCASRDSDNDGENDCDDACPNDPDKTQAGLCGCGVADGDGDGDGIADCDDGCPADANKTSPGDCGCGTPDDGDSDGDGTADCSDDCPSDGNKTAPGTCGCGTPDDDTDEDGTADCDDACPANHSATAEPCGGPGLLEGALSGAFNTSDPNNGNVGIDPLGPTRSEIIDGPEDTTYVLTGEVYVPASGVLSFYENYDDAVLLVIDGTTILNDEVWDAPTAGTFTAAEGWYGFELRLGNGVSASGPPSGIGFGYAPSDTGGSTDPAMYSLPRNSDATSGDFFRVP